MTLGELHEKIGAAIAARPSLALVHVAARVNLLIGDSLMADPVTSSVTAVICDRVGSPGSAPIMVIECDDERIELVTELPPQSASKAVN